MIAALLIPRLKKTTVNVTETSTPTKVFKFLINGTTIAIKVATMEKSRWY
jgi:hypothetical protein